MSNVNVAIRWLHIVRAKSKLEHLMSQWLDLWFAIIVEVAGDNNDTSLFIQCMIYLYVKTNDIIYY